MGANALPDRRARPRYVVKGKLKVTEDGKVNTYSVGEVFWESGKLMAVENVGAETAELIIFELALTH
jgi:quercetin dioxygenase-like cupin family protein